MYYVYVLRRKRGDKFYIGSTNNLGRRMMEHRTENDFRLIYYEAYQSEKIARNREKRLKYYGSAWRALKKRIAA